MGNGKKCIVCGQELTGKQRKYCSDKCTQRAHYVKNQDKRKEWQKAYYERNRESRINYSRQNKNKNPKYYKQYMKANRAKFILKDINRRCYDKTHKSYRYYGAKGIINLLSLSDIEGLLKNIHDCPICGKPMMRDSKTDKPTIDRIDSKGHYELSNVRIICKSCNSRRARKGNINFP